MCYILAQFFHKKISFKSNELLALPPNWQISLNETHRSIDNMIYTELTKNVKLTTTQLYGLICLINFNFNFIYIF
jgi:hypothetical protein